MVMSIRKYFKDGKCFEPFFWLKPGRMQIDYNDNIQDDKLTELVGELKDRVGKLKRDEFIEVEFHRGTHPKPDSQILRWYLEWLGLVSKNKGSNDEC
jgi:hypothetical protein